MVEQETITVEEIEKACVDGWDRVLGIVLFGSRARGDGGSGADWDLGIVFRQNGEGTEPDFEVPGDWDLFLWDDSRWEDGFALQVEMARDGIILKDFDQNIERRFEKIREYILPHWAGYLKRL
ncbi:MAG: nucleotidyltransferase domain-containing protein [Leptospiraceae bacterium]|nr:nucleotidyltransferase domain-containing protein [Leptospiraceae bacterium]